MNHYIQTLVLVCVTIVSSAQGTLDKNGFFRFNSYKDHLGYLDFAREEEVGFETRFVKHFNYHVFIAMRLHFLSL